MSSHSKFGVQQADKRRKARDKPRGAVPLCINPALLTLILDSFVDAKGQPVTQIPFSDVGANKEGIAFGAINELSPFLREGKILSDSPLAWVLTPVPAELRGSLIVADLRYPAQYEATAEPVLIQGSLVLLGQAAITRKQPAKHDLAHLATQALRLTVYQDQWPSSWSALLDRPIRALLEQVPVLQLCRAEGCGTTCKKFHPPVDESIEVLILDVWSRCWLSAAGKFCAPTEATQFSAMIRVPSSAQLPIQLASGINGLYVEPRSQCGKLADQTYGVVWMQNATLQDVKHKLTTMKHAVCACRMMSKYGLRFLQEHLEEAYSTLRPSDTFVNSRISKIFKHGTQRSGLQRWLTTWGWAARVLHAAGGGPEGSAWEVGAADPPPSTVLQGSFGDVTVTLIRQASLGSTPAPILASTSTKRHIQTGQAQHATSSATSAPSDLWLVSSLSPKALTACNSLRHV